MRLSSRAVIGLAVMTMVLVVTSIVMLPIGGKPTMPINPKSHELVPMITGVPIVVTH